MYIMKIVFLDAATMGDVSFEPIAAKGELVCYDSSTPHEALERVADCDVLIVCFIFVGGIALLVPVIMIAIAAGILKACL